MYERYFQHFNEKVPLTEEEQAFIRNYLTVKKLRKRQYLLQEGDVCKCVARNKTLNNVKEKVQITKQQVEQKLNKADDELNTKLDKMEQQMKQAGEKRKARLQKRINALKELYRVRTGKLKQASTLINQACGAKKENAALKTA